MASKEESKASGKVTEVQLDGLVLLKIIKHSHENPSKAASGQLFGLDIEGRLEITQAFPYPAEETQKDESYEEQVMRLLRAVNVEHQAVGWFQSSTAGSFLSPTHDKSIPNFLDIQYDWQVAVPNSVVVVYDPSRTNSGRLAIKAYRLSDAYMKARAAESSSSTSSATSKSSSSTSSTTELTGDLLEELPIKVHNSHLVHGFLYELRENKSMRCDFDRLSLNFNPQVERNLDLTSQCIDDYLYEQGQFQYYQRQMARLKQQKDQYLQKLEEENSIRKQQGKSLRPDESSRLFKPLPKPSRQDTFLLSNKITFHSGQIANATQQGLNKMYVVNAFHQKS